MAYLDVMTNVIVFVQYLRVNIRIRQGQRFFVRFIRNSCIRCLNKQVDKQIHIEQIESMLKPNLGQHNMERTSLESCSSHASVAGDRALFVFASDTDCPLSLLVLTLARSLIAVRLTLATVPVVAAEESAAAGPGVVTVKSTGAAAAEASVDITEPAWASCTCIEIKLN